VAAPTLDQLTGGGAARAPGLPGRQLAAQQAAEDERAAVEVTGEAGGTVTEAPVTKPSLNEARRRRSRSGRIYR
jgi:predicted enzyme related to lactoylglutathione lyase